MAGDSYRNLLGYDPVQSTWWLPTFRGTYSIHLQVEKHDIGVSMFLRNTGNHEFEDTMS
jgi:hypothetical protein